MHELTALSAVGLVIWFCEKLYRTGKVRTEITRKLAHFAAYLIAAISMAMLPRESFMIICGLSAGAIWILRKYRLLPSIESVPRSTIGSYLLPMGFAVIALSSYRTPIAFYALSVVGIADTLAAFIREVMGKHPYSYQIGSAAFLIISIVLGLLFLPWEALLPVAICATIGEYLSDNGLDNLFVPILTILTYAIISI